MSPYQHGEVFVTEDGAETDLDLGHYERFIDENTSIFSNVTSGKIYQRVIQKERNGDFLGATVQVVPHITDEIKNSVYNAARSNPEIDVVITEIGGTVGDIESTPFLEAIRQIPFDAGRENVLYVHVTLLPYIAASHELKTKPTQHSVKELQNIGITPDIIVCRTERDLGMDSKRKIALFCNVTADAVIQNKDAETLYEVPLMLEREGLASVVCKKLNLTKQEPDLREWTALVEKIKDLSDTCQKVKIALVGKYVEMRDAYMSIGEAIRHAGYANDANIGIEWIQAEDVTAAAADKLLKDADGILVPGGFGDRGFAGKIIAAGYARAHNIPFLGICFGMHAAVIDFARNVIGLKDANTEEFDTETANPIIHILPDKKSNADMGGTLRLGNYPCVLSKGSLAEKVYGTSAITERHRHRYEFNNKYKDIFAAHGMNLCGISPDGTLLEMVEIPAHKWYIAVQFHPEFKSRPNRPHPLFAAFIEASLNGKGKKKNNR
jgi:CTP synthase